MTQDDRWRHHAYDYGWRRVFLGDHEQFSPIDPPDPMLDHGEWFNAVMAQRAEQFLRERFNRPLPEPVMRDYTESVA